VRRILEINYSWFSHENVQKLRIVQIVLITYHNWSLSFSQRFDRQ